MGVDNLAKLLNKYAPHASRIVPLRELGGRRAAVDMSIEIYKWHSVGSSRAIVNARGELINHLQGALMKASKLKEANVDCVYVFDGPPPDEKAAELEKRREGKKTKMHSRVFDDVRYLLLLLGVPVVEAPSEAEACAAVLCDLVVTTDTDALLFGAETKATISGDKVTLTDRSAVMTEFGLSNSEFVDLCILLGTDYSPRVAGIGPVKALKLVQQYRTLEAIEKIIGPLGIDYVGTRRVIARQMNIKPKWPKTASCDAAAVLRFLVDERGLDRKRVEAALVRFGAAR